VIDTRKTTPGLRALEKYAVRSGGGANHRPDLGSGILIKDNHVALVGSVREAVRRARANAPHTLRVVVEVDTMAQLEEALEAGAEGTLLDNFQTRDMSDAVKRVRDRRPQTVIEASGGISLDRVREVSKTGVDVISVGALTHSARAINYSFEIRPVDGTAAREPTG
jgi:nicotinate-nucleotide pyrophosphorylase (carboxylating)